jgi:Fe-S-cluster-containing hydrogenase component 2
MKQDFRVRLDHPERCLGCYNCVFACSFELFGVVSAARTAISIKPCSPADRFVVTFCTDCEEPPCVTACKPQALKKGDDGKLKLVVPSECDECEEFDCVRACISGALALDPETKKPILCTQCGKCAEACPHEVIVYREDGK